VSVYPNIFERQLRSDSADSILKTLRRAGDERRSCSFGRCWPRGRRSFGRGRKDRARSDRLPSSLLRPAENPHRCRAGDRSRAVDRHPQMGDLHGQEEASDRAEHPRSPDATAGRHGIASRTSGIRTRRPAQMRPRPAVTRGSSFSTTASRRLGRLPHEVRRPNESGMVRLVSQGRPTSHGFQRRHRASPMERSRTLAHPVHRYCRWLSG
jgi:hypothetical protein